MSAEISLSTIVKHDRPLADAVFVHGLTGSAKETWHPNSDGVGEDYWLHWIAKDVRGTNVHVVDYSSAFVRRRGRTELPWHDFAKSFLEKCSVAQIGTRPLVFVCHSLGGLLVKEALRRASRTTDPGWIGILKRCRHICFLGTPHSEVALTRLTRVFPRATLTPEMGLLANVEGELGALFEDYVAIVNETDIETSVFYETQPMKGLPIIVPKKDAHPGTLRTKDLPIVSDHVGLSKPKLRSTLLYESIRSALERVASGAPYADPAIVARVRRELMPPAPPYGIRRENLLRDLRDRAEGGFVVAAVGLPGSGKSSLVGDFLVDTLERTFWFTSTTGCSLRDLLAVVSGLSPTATEDELSRIRGFLDWLDTSDSVLVIDDYQRADSLTFTPLLQLAAKRRGPARLFLLSRETLKQPLPDASTLEVGGFTPDEARSAWLEAGISLGDEVLELLETSSGLLPVFVVSARQIYVADGGLDSGVVRMDGASKSAIVQKWTDQVLAALPDSVSQLLTQLAHCDEQFDLGLVEWLVREYGVDVQPHEIVQQLSQQLILIRCASDKWKVAQPLVEGIRGRSSSGTRGSAHRAIGDYLYEPWMGKKVDRRALSRTDLVRLGRACRHFQQAPGRSQSKSRIIDLISIEMRHHGLHRQLIEVLQNEVLANPDKDYWTNLKLAQSYIALGEAADAFRVLEPLVTKLLFAEDANDTLRLAFIRTLAELLVYLGMNRSANAILDRGLRLFDVAKLAWNVVSQTRSVLVGTMIRSGNPQAALELNASLLREVVQAGDPIGQAVAHTRQGLAYSELERWKDAVDSFRIAQNLFQSRDKRGLAWSSLHLAQALSRHGEADNAELALFTALAVNLEHSFSGEDYFAICEYFADRVTTEPVRLLLEIERTRLLGVEKNRQLVEAQIGQADALEAALLITTDGMGEPRNLEPTRSVLEMNPRKMRSELYKSFVASSVRHDPDGAVSSLFAEYGATRVIQTPLFSKILTEAAKKKPQIEIEFIRPNLPLIQEGTDSTLFHFARYFEQVAKRSVALELLERVRNRNSFNYHNIKANCLRKSDSALSAEHDTLALKFAWKPQLKARILTNMAKAIHDDRRARSRYDEAKKLCVEAVRLRYSPRFHWPSDLLLALEIETSEWNDIAAVVATARNRLGFSESAANRAIELVHDQGRRRAALSSLRSNFATAV